MMFFLTPKSAAKALDSLHLNIVIRGAHTLNVEPIVAAVENHLTSWKNHYLCFDRPEQVWSRSAWCVLRNLLGKADGSNLDFPSCGSSKLSEGQYKNSAVPRCALPRSQTCASVRSAHCRTSGWKRLGKGSTPALGAVTSSAAGLLSLELLALDSILPCVYSRKRFSSLVLTRAHFPSAGLGRSRSLCLLFVRDPTNCSSSLRAAPPSIPGPVHQITSWPQQFLQLCCQLSYYALLSYNTSSLPLSVVENWGAPNFKTAKGQVKLQKDVKAHNAHMKHTSALLDTGWRCWQVTAADGCSMSVVAVQLWQLDACIMPPNVTVLARLGIFPEQKFAQSKKKSSHSGQWTWP